MGEGRTRRPKVASLNRYKKFARLRGLRCFRTVEKMLSDGYQPAQVADYIQDDCGEYADAQRQTLAKLLGQYRKDILLSTGEAAATNAPGAYLKAAREMTDGVKIEKELEDLFRTQRARINYFAELEESSGLPLKGMSREIDAARLLLDEIHRVRLDLGVDERHIGTLTIKAEAIAACEERYGARIADVMRNPEKRRRVLAFMEAALRQPPELPEKVIDVEATESEVG